MIEAFGIIREKLRTKKYYICICLSVLLVTVLCLWNLNGQTRVRRIDEIGYWGIAAQLAGYDWKDIMSHLSYYSFGYSILLVPILGLHHLGVSMASCYQIAIFINIIMLDATIFMALYVAKRWVPKINKYYRLMCVLTITLYSNNILQSNTAWPETCIYFLYWLILSLLIKMLESISIKKNIDKTALTAVVILSAYVFCVHMRTIAVPITVFLILTGYFLKSKFLKNGFNKKILLKIGIIVAIIVIVVLGCISLTEIFVYQLNEPANGVANTLSETFASLKNYISIEGVGDIFLSFLGKVYYQGIASYLLSFFGFGVLVKKYIVGYFIRSEKSIPINIIQFGSAVFVIISSVGSLLVSSIYMSDCFLRGIPWSARADRVVYGRYTEFLVPVLMLVALLHLGQLRRYFDVIMGSIFCLLLTSCAVQYQWDLISFYHRDITLGIGVESIIDYYDGFQNTAYNAALLVAGIFSLICLLCALRNGIKIVRISIVIVLSLIFMVKGVNNTQALPKIHKEKTIGSVAELLKAIPESDIYCVGSPDVDIQILQWELADRTIHVINANELSQIDKAKAVIISDMDDAIIGEVNEYADFIYSSGTIAVYANKDILFETELCSKLSEARQMVQGTTAEVDLKNAVGECGYMRADGYIYSSTDRKEGFVSQNTGMKLPDGVYEFEIELEIKHITGDKIGYILITDKQEASVNVVEILPEEVGFGGKAKIIVDGQIQNFCEPIVGIYTYGNSDITVKGIYCKQSVSETPRNEAEQDELRRIFEIIDAESLRKKKIYYIDSDGSGVNGNPNITTGTHEQFIEEELKIYQLPTWAVKYQKNKARNVYIMEKGGEYTKLMQFMDGFYNRYETQHFILYAEER